MGSFHISMDNPNTLKVIDEKTFGLTICYQDGIDWSVQEIENASFDIKLGYTESGQIIVCVVVGKTVSYNAFLDMTAYSKFTLRPPPETGYMMSVNFIDNRTEIVRIIRMFNLNYVFSKKIYELAFYQWEHNFSCETACKNYNKLSDDRITTDTLVQMRIEGAYIVPNMVLTYYAESVLKKMVVLEAAYDSLFCIVPTTQKSIQYRLAIEAGTIKIDLCYIEGIIFLCLNIEDVLIFRTPFHMAQYTEFQLIRPETYGCYHMIILLVDSDSKEIYAKRIIALEKKICSQFYQLAQHQWKHKLSNYGDKLIEISDKYTTKQMVEETSVAHTIISGIY